MARGLLTGFLDIEKLPADDVRKLGHLPQFNKDNIAEVSFSEFDRADSLCTSLMQIGLTAPRLFNMKVKL